ncbi:LOW QUALITY PROTEIN: phosphoserine phosphatase-like [Dendronephthya gigantea]|uniref:LOW QUALITY PROTEIN: phosphoserine phosphatase-like n=1 Tax=Dendronephthya gigantea TaxID=151771 RepID=UPI0010699278|nr:LOW QUALITY PROTEIN: phosphoserine phosphatase-like [Dendronephthya gigantea]
MPPNTRKYLETLSQDDLKEIWRTADCVCFDVDSTVVKEEGIDELAEFCGVGDAVRQWTLQAMGGNIRFRTALETRLNMCNPTLEQLEQYRKDKPLTLTPGVKELIAYLHRERIPVFLISGGFKQLNVPLAHRLGIPSENVYSVELLFDADGRYHGFNKNNLTSDSGGKTKVVQRLKDKYGFKRLVMIGDGATDMETCPPADAFIGFGGNVIREKVRENSPWFVTSFQELLDELKVTN